MTKVCPLGHETVIVRWSGEDGTDAAPRCDVCGSVELRAPGQAGAGAAAPAQVRERWLWTECSNGHKVTAVHPEDGRPECPMAVLGETKCTAKVWRYRGLGMRRIDPFSNNWYENSVPTLETDGAATIEEWRRTGKLRVDPSDGVEKGYFETAKQRDAAFKDLNARTDGRHVREVAAPGVSEGARERERQREIEKERPRRKGINDFRLR